MTWDPTSHSVSNYNDLMTQYNDIDTTDPDSVEQFTEAMYKIQQGVSFDMNFATAWHSIMKVLLGALGRV